MKAKPVIGIIVVVLAVFGIGVWYFNSHYYKIAQLQTIQTGPIISPPESLTDIMAAGQPVKCLFAGAGDKGNIAGTFYVASGMARGDYSIYAGNNGNQTTNAHKIVDSSIVYTWSDGQAVGTKTALTAPGSVTNGQVSQKQDFDLGQKLYYTCEPWSQDPSLFVLPDNVKFE